MLHVPLVCLFTGMSRGWVFWGRFRREGLFGEVPGDQGGQQLPKKPVGKQLLRRQSM